MGDVFNGIGLVSGILGIIGFFQSNVPGADPQGAKVQIKAGLADDNVSATGGDFYAAYAWDINNNYLGQSGGGTVTDGGFTEVTINQDSPGVQADFVGVGFGHDEICVAWITVKQFDGSDQGVWTGDIGENCGGGPHYVGGQVAGQLPNGGGDYRPDCVWFDADHDNDRPNAALKFRSRAYGSQAQDTIDNNHACQSTIFNPDPSAIGDEPAKRAVKRALKKRSPWIEKRLVVSNITDARHTAEYLCTTPTTYGPDFVGNDGRYCDMGTKTLIPLCSTENVEGCIDLNHENKTVSKRSTVARRSVNLAHRSYDRIDSWTN